MFDCQSLVSDDSLSVEANFNKAVCESFVSFGYDGHDPMLIRHHIVLRNELVFNSNQLCAALIAAGWEVAANEQEDALHLTVRPAL